MRDPDAAVRRLSVGAALAALLVLASSAPSQGAIQRIPMRAKEGIGEFQPAHSGAYFGWEQNSKANLDHYDVFVHRAGGKRRKVNAPKTQAAMGGIDGNILVYQQFWGTRTSDIRFLNLRTGKRYAPRVFVNTRLWEYWPSISGDWLLFGRRTIAGDKRRIILYNRARDAVRLLDITSSTSTFLAPGQVNGNWAVWHRCKPPTKCDVYRYNIALRATRKIPNPTDKSQYAASVTRDGTVFFARGRRTCGRGVQLMRYRDGRPRALHRLKRGRDVGDTYASLTASGEVQLFFEQNRCGRLASGSDIFRVRFL
jgi:hypothetical protein